MRRLAAFVAASALLFALGTVAVLAADPPLDPRCADWEQNGAPPGIDMRLVCTASEVIGTYTGQTPVDVTREPAFAWAAAALITGVGLAAVAVVAGRFVGGRAGRRLAPESPDAWWVCPGCHSLNAVGRPACYECQTSPGAVGTPDGPLVLRRED